MPIRRGARAGIVFILITLFLDILGLGIVIPVLPGLVDAFVPGGGYILAPSNHYMEDIPLDNFYAIYETVREYGGG